MSTGRASRIFQSTPPARGATRVTEDGWWRSEFQSTPPARGATPAYLVVDGLPGISIHAPREGGDAPFVVPLSLSTGFQSTPPARGATPLECQCP